jgi:hypothetical protein
MVAMKSTTVWSGRPTHHKGYDRTMGIWYRWRAMLFWSRVQSVLPLFLYPFLLMLGRGEGELAVMRSGEWGFQTLTRLQHFFFFF